MKGILTDSGRKLRQERHPAHQTRLPKRLY